LTAPIWRPEKVGNVPFRSMLGAALCLLAMGCQTQAPPKRAEIREQALARITLPEAWKAGAQAGAISDNWLASFNDPQLDALVIEALAHNPDLRVTATRVEQAAQQVELAKSTMLPALNLFGTGGVNMGGGDALRILSLGVSWEIDLWGRLRYGQYAAQDNHASAQSDFEFARQSLAATLAKSWFAASETRLQRQIADESVMAAQQLLALAVKRQQVGAGTEQDIALARASLGTVQDNARQLRQAHEQAIRALELLLGRYPATDLKSRTDLAGMPSPVPAGMPLETLERRPDLIAAERRVAAAFNRVGEAKAAQLPRLNLNANIAALSSDILALREDFDNPTGGLGANLLAPIYLGGALRTQVEIRNIEQKQALADYARMAMRALGDVENALAAEATLAERETLLRHALADNQRALDLTQTGYRVGKTDLRAVLQQQLSVYAARLSLLRVRSEQLTQRVNLHLALGGSFETRPPQRAAEVRTP
jgi:NodT family efflux transporter outer membrane factor (OMF) lipoprotein